MGADVINALVLISMIILALSLLFFVASALPLLAQARRTLTSYERLANTLDVEVPATLNEFKQLAEKVNFLGHEYGQKVTDVGHRVEEVSGSLGIAAHQARKQSSVFGSALFAGVKAYLSGDNQESRQEEASEKTRQMITGKGEKNVRQ